MAEPSRPQVLIVGAGPTGLVLALWLARAGIPVRIIDKAERPGTTSRAIVVHARTLEFYRQLGIDTIAINRGIEFRSVNLWLRGRRIAAIPFNQLGTDISPHPFALMLTQDQHEDMLIEQLAAINVHVERRTELVRLVKDSEEVIAEIKLADGRSEKCRVRYLAGCDGAHSTVREQLGVGFAGGTYDDMFYVADIQGSGPAIDGNMHGALDDADFLAIFPMRGNGRVRLVGVIRRDLMETKASSLTWDDVSPRILERMEMNVEHVNWFSTYHVHHRVASHFQKGRTFLLGDAAHIHSPVGGQGMNTGIGDAVNLAWKLAAVLKGEASSAILETYEPERIAFARRLVATTDRAFTFVSARGWLARIVRVHLVPLIVPFVFRFRAIRRLMFLTVSQTAISYPQSPLSENGLGMAGRRLPWLRSNEPIGDNYVSLQTRQWQVHCYGEVPDAVESLCCERSLRLERFAWTSEMAPRGLKRDAAYLIRPDGHIAIVILRADVAHLRTYLDKWQINLVR